MFTPDQFRVNEAWIIIRVNDEFLFIEDEPHDVYVLMDACSLYAFGYMLSCVADETPNEKDVKALFEKAWSAKKQWAEGLIVTENSIAESVFRKQAQKNGLSVEIVPLADLEPIVGSLRELFASGFDENRI